MPTAASGARPGPWASPRPTGPALTPAPGYRSLVRYFAADYVMLSGWLKLAAGLDPARTINIHPGPLPRFGGPKLYGHFVHNAVPGGASAGARSPTAP